MRTRAETSPNNPLELDGLEFIEFVASPSSATEAALVRLGFVKIGQHKRKAVSLYRQNQINLIVNQETSGFAARYFKLHGPSISALGLRVRHALRAFDKARTRGARPLTVKPDPSQHSFPAIFGVGDAAIYFVDRYRAPNHFDDDFRYLQPELRPRGRGLVAVEAVTAAVPKGDLARWTDFFVRVLGAGETQTFNVMGERTGLRESSA